MNATHIFFRSSVNSGVIGGLVGMMVSGAAQVKNYKAGKINATDAGICVGKEAVGSGVATGASVAVAGVVGHSLLLALAVGIGVKYAWDAGVEKLENKSSSLESA